jgi:glycosyltransferase involved in cell wall biosynthesis
MESAVAAHLKIAHVHTRMLGGGGDRVSELESVSLSKRGHAVTVVGSMTHDISARLVNAGVRTIKATPAECRVGDLKAATGPLDVVHCHCMLSAPFAAELASATASVLVLHNHSVGEEWWECHRAVSKFRRARRVRRKLIDRAAAQASRIICVSPTVLGHMRAIGLPTENAVLIPNPVPDAYFSSPISEDDYSYDVCTLARASRAKRPLSVLRILSLAARRAPGLRLSGWATWGVGLGF